MPSFNEFESAFLAKLQQERSDLQSLQGKLEAQLSAWIEHVFREYLGYTWKEIVHPEGTPIGSKGSKQLFPDLRIDVLDTGLIFIECKRLGRLDGARSQEERDEGIGQLQSYIHAHLYRATVKPKTLLGIVTDGNRWFLRGLNKTGEFHTIAEWAFLTDDPRLIAQRLWLLAKPALAQPTTPLVEFLARRTLADVLRDNTRSLTKKVNEKLPDGAVSEELIGKWLRDAFSDPAVSPRLLLADSSSACPEPPQETALIGAVPLSVQRKADAGASDPERHALRKRFWQGLLGRPKAKGTRHANIAPSKYSWISAGSGVWGIPFTYSIGQQKGRVELYIDRGAGKTAENKVLFDRIHQHKEEIERAFGRELSWERLDDKQGCRVALNLIGGGYRSNESKWPAIQDAMIDAMIRLEQAFAPILAKLKTESASGGV